MKKLLQCIAAFSLILWQMIPAHGQIYGGTTSGGGSTSTGCTGTSVVNGVVSTTATPTCQSDSGFTYTPGTGIVVTGGATVSTLLMNGTGLIVESATSSGTQEFAYGYGLSGTVAGSPYMQVGTGSGNSQGWIFGTASNGLSANWPTIATPTSNNYTILSNGGVTRLNSTGSVAFSINNSEYLTVTTTTLTPSFSALNMGTSGLPFGNAFLNGAVSAGSYVGNSNGISPTAGNIGQEQEFSVASTGAVVTVSSATPVTIVSSGATVTAGDYDVSGN